MLLTCLIVKLFVLEPFAIIIYIQMLLVIYSYLIDLFHIVNHENVVVL